MDHDQLFKDLLTTFFAEFLELFFPELAAEMDREHIEFLDKELYTDIGTGDQHEVDLLARVRLHGADAFILVHVENQATAQAEFPKRMFHYFAMLHKKHDLPVFPIAIFSYDKPLTPAADTYAIDLFRFPILRFQFQTIQLNRLNWRDFVSRPNPVASALMAKMKIAPEDRPRVKLECLRMMLTLKFDPARTRLISRFMNSYLRLTSDEAVVYNRHVDALHPKVKETLMRHEEEYLEEHVVSGQMKERRKFICKFLTHLFGTMPNGMKERIDRLSYEQSDALADAMYEFQTVVDAQLWLSKIEFVQPVE